MKKNISYVANREFSPLEKGRMKCHITMALQPINFSNKRLLGVTLYTVIIDCFHTSENRKRRLKKKIVPISNCEPMTVLLCVKPFLLFSRFCQQQIISVPAGWYYSPVFMRNIAFPNHLASPNHPFVFVSFFSICECTEAEAEIILQLKSELREKELKLTDIRLEALSSAHHLDQIREAMNRMQVSAGARNAWRDGQYCLLPSLSHLQKQISLHTFLWKCTLFIQSL